MTLTNTHNLESTEPNHLIQLKKFAIGRTINISPDNAFIQSLINRRIGCCENLGSFLHIAVFVSVTVKKRQCFIRH